MRARRTFVFAACTTLLAAAYGPIAHAQNPSTSLTIPQSPEVPVSPTTPGTLPGTTAQDTTIGANPITGAPCVGGGASAINGGIPGAPTQAGQPGQPGTNLTGLPPSSSVYGLSSQLPNTTNPGAC
jgi:hypothetical protein